MILVGGFGDNKYLADALQAWCFENGNIKLLIPDHPQATVMKGATLRGLRGTKLNIRRCRYHYGITIYEPFREGIDPRDDGFI